jgi:predicted dehydrogenase
MANVKMKGIFYYESREGALRDMDSRRQFLGAVTGLATTLAVPKKVLGANETVRLGIIGAGDRGSELMRQAVECPGVEFAGICDIYTRRLETARQIAPHAKTYLDHRRMLEDKSIDAVLIATPQHLHCEHFVHSIEAGKHVYQEKTLAFNVDHAKRMRAAFLNAGKRVVQVGHQWCSSGQMVDARRFATSAPMGKITAMQMYRNTPHGKPQWSRPVYPDMTPENILWKSFEGEAAPHRFDANRYINWRFFWDYSGGNVYENMCHQLCFWYKALNLRIPNAATMTGGVYLWKDGREVPDTMNVSLQQPEEILVSWDSGFGNNEPGISEAALGTDGTITHASQVRYAPQKVNQPSEKEIVGTTRSASNAHMQNFIDCVRDGKEPNCPFELGFRVAIACRMTVESYRQGRTIRWSAEHEELV